MSIEIVFYLLLTFLFLCYCVIHFLAVKGLNALIARQQESSLTQPQISVIIAARNEEANIGRCLQSLVQQNYPVELFEIIVADDRSTDGTAAIVKNYQLKYPIVKSIKVETISSDLPPKKNALNEAITQSRFNILAFTDADCVASPQWLSSLAKEFLPTVGVVAGYSPIEQQFPTTSSAHWGDLFLRYLETKNSVGAAAAIGLNKAYLCTGRNLSYRKSVFYGVGGFEKIKHSISGDDDLFIQRVQKKSQWKLRYMLSPESYVETQPPTSVRAFINQRKRHFSAGKYYPLRMKIVYSLIHSYNGLALLSLFLFPPFGITTLIGKFIIDGFILYKGTALFGNSRLLRSIFPLEIASIVYNLLIGPLGFFGTFNWKGNKS